MSQPRFLLDEHVWGGLIAVGNRLGIDVVATREFLPEGAADEDVLALAAQQQRILLTGNTRDFAPKTAEWFLSGREHWGIVIVPGKTDKSLLSHALERICLSYSAESFQNTLRFIQEFV